MKRILPALVALLLLTTPVAAQFYDQDQLLKVEEVRVVVEDNVKDGCLPQPNALKVEAELILRRSGIKVVEELGAVVHTLLIAPSGYAPTGLLSFCVASLGVDLWRFQLQRDGTSGLVMASTNDGALSAPKGDFQQHLRESVNIAVTALANELLKARGQ